MKFFYSILLLNFSAVSSFGSSLADSILYQSWNTDSSNWQNEGRELFFISAGCRLDSMWGYEYNNSLNSWVLNSKSYYEYNSQNQKKTVTFYTYNGNIKTPSIKRVFNYQNNFLSDSLIMYWESSANAFVDNYRYSFYRNGSRVDSSHTDYWDKNAAQWKPQDRYYNIYDTASGFVSITTIRQNFSGVEWRNSSKIILSSVLATGNLDEQANLVWDFSQSKWVFESRYVWTYDNQNRINLMLYELYDATNGIWKSYGKYSYSHVGNQTILTAENYDANISSWANYYKTTFNTACNTTSAIENVFVKNLEVYPNPTTDVFQISNSGNIQSISIFDFSGKLMFKQTANANVVSVSLSNLASGIYLLQAETNEGIAVKRLIKE